MAGRSQIRFGLIGLGRHGSRYAQHLLSDVPGARLVAICRRDREKGQAFARRYGLTFHGDYRQLIRDPQVQAVAVAVSPDLNVDICRQAVIAGKHILLEKPMARNRAEGQQIFDLVEHGPVKFMLAQTLRFNSVVRKIREHVGRLGQLHLMAFNQRMERHGLAWLDDPQIAGGGNLLHTGVHIFDLACFLSDREVDWAWCQNRRIHHQRTEDLFAAVLSLGGDIECLADACKVAGGRTGRIELVGDKGQLIGDHILGTLVLIEDRQPMPIDHPPPVHTVQKALETFLDCIAKDRRPPITARDGLRTLEVVEMCYRSAESGRIVRRQELFGANEQKPVRGERSC